jgi:hypothetical protein
MFVNTRKDGITRELMKGATRGYFRFHVVYNFYLFYVKLMHFVCIFHPVIHD